MLIAAMAFIPLITGVATPSRFGTGAVDWPLIFGGISGKEVTDEGTSFPVSPTPRRC